jgi:hypothetical protein
MEPPNALMNSSLMEQLKNCYQKMTVVMGILLKLFLFPQFCFNYFSTMTVNMMQFPPCLEAFFAIFLLPSELSRFSS